MPFSNYLISDFKIARPRFETSQELGFSWLAACHTQAEFKLRNGNFSDDERKIFEENILKEAMHVGCKPSIIKKRGHVLKDFLHKNWDEMLVYRLNESAKGVGLEKRTELYNEFAGEAIEKLYPEGCIHSQDMIHVSCTGYVSPSPLQQLVSKRGWGKKTCVTHAYHMGCYASLPAIKMGLGFLRSNRSSVDVVHTEVCTLHNNPANHQRDQYVAQTLFADGFIKYTLASLNKSEQKVGLKVLCLYEETIPNSCSAMTWQLSNWGFAFSLSREIPALISQALDSYLDHLCACAHLSRSDILKNAIFAIHPGGPKVIDYIKKGFGLEKDQIHWSQYVLENYGNMSSATLPHVWDKICQDETIPGKTKVISLAFGPGLTISGAILEKIGS